MIDSITKFPTNNQEEYFFSILVPTWNNLPLLQLCIRSIRENSFRNIQIIVIVNEGKDGTVEWLENQGNIDYIHAQQNIGICYGLNAARSLVTTDYIMYINDDMYVLPDWDKSLYQEIQSIGHKSFFLSATMIEPRNTGNSCVVVSDYGDDIDSFDEKGLLDNQSSLIRGDWLGSTWPPNVVHIDTWDIVGGLSIEFSPGMYSDPDFSKKLYDAGVRIFKGKGDSLVYHFGSKSTKRVKKNKGRSTFLLKWGISSNFFRKNYLHIGDDPSTCNLNEAPKSPGFVNKLKRIVEVIKE